MQFRTHLFQFRPLVGGKSEVHSVYAPAGGRLELSGRAQETVCNVVGEAQLERGGHSSSVHKGSIEWAVGVAAENDEGAEQCGSKSEEEVQNGQASRLPLLRRATLARGMLVRGGVRV